MILQGDCFEQMATLRPNSVDAIVTDPPYELNFMGKGWDATGVAFRVRTWSAAHRVLKPGGYLLAFGSTRTYHRIAVAIEDAGFEIRDTIAWMYGSGFPKSLDVAKQIDKEDANAERLQRAFKFQMWLRRTGMTAQRINRLTGTDMGHHLTTHPTQPFVATADVFDLLRPMLPKPPEWVEELVRERTVESEQFKLREKLGEREMVDTSRVTRGFAGERYNDPEDVGAKRIVDITAAYSENAKKWEGWGTALKPAFEPVVVARKPLATKGVAHNVVALGTGALNIDGCRIETMGRPGRARGEVSTEGRSTYVQDFASGVSVGETTKGRWPANVILDEEAAELLDEETGDLGRSSGTQTRGNEAFGTGVTYGSGEGFDEDTPVGFGDRGGASRFFYCAKASKSERNAGLEDFPQRPVSVGDDRPSGGMHERYGDANGSGRTSVSQNHHPTVKPVSLMRYLVRLVTPPGGTVLDPFLGSGTTGIAAKLEGFEFVGVELDPEYARIAEARISHWSPE